MAFRFANMMFEPIWNRNYIDHIQITGAEDIGIGTRAGYYDQAGALRDLVQNHMLQLVALTCMEPPATFEADKVRDEKVKVLDGDHAARPRPRPCARSTPRASVGRARTRSATSRRRASRTTRTPRPTRRSSSRSTTGAGRACRSSCAPASGSRARSPRSRSSSSRCRTSRSSRQGSVGVQPNQLILTVQPNEGVSLSLGAKIPGSTMRIRPVNMEFLYGSAFMSQSPEAYERLILDAMRGDATLFTRNDEVDAQWRDHRPDPRGMAQPRRGRAAGDVHVGLGRARPRPTGCSATGSGASCERGRLERAGHDAERDRGGAARPARPPLPGGPHVRARAGDEPRRDRRPRLPRRGREPAGAGRALPPVAAGHRRGRAGAHDARRLGDRRGRGRGPQARPHRGRARAGRGRDRPAARREPRHDRRPAAGARPRHHGLGAARARARPSRRCGGWPTSCSSTRRTTRRCGRVRARRAT